MGLVLAAAIATVLALVRPATVVHDWHGWRQADTQTIAYHYATGELDLLHPQIAWGGDGPGYVEAELQVYTAVLGVLLRSSGSLEPSDGEWLGRALSACALAFAAFLLWWWLRRGLALGPAPAALGALAFITARGTVYLVSVQPDALGLLATTGALVLFARWLREGRAFELVFSSLLLALAAGIKPTFLAAGVAEVLLVVALAPRRLRQPSLWFAWALTVAFVAFVLLHGASVHSVWGNTFGVVSGGDSKFPTWDRLTSPMQYVKLALTGLEFGPGPVGALGLVLVLWRRRGLPREGALTTLSLWAAYALTGVVAMRYACEAWLGSHYHALGLVAGAFGLGVGLSGLGQPVAPLASGPCWARVRTPILAALVGLQLALAVRSRSSAADGWATGEVTVGTALRKELERTGRTRPGAALSERPLVVVRSAVASATETGAANNFEDPRIFYLAGARGWVLPAEEGEVRARLPELVACGALYYVDPTDWISQHPNDANWLADHAVAVAPGIYRLRGDALASPPRIR